MKRARILGGKDAPLGRAVERSGTVVATPTQMERLQVMTGCRMSR